MTKVRKLHDYIIYDQVLGNGSTGRVLLGQQANPPKNLVAVKEINLKDIEQNMDKSKQLKNEITNMELLKDVNSPYIVRLYDCIRTDNHIFIILELCEDGDLKSHMMRRNGSLPVNQAVIFLRHMVEGYRQLHRRNIIHRDLKPANILLKQKIAKISDFGFSRILEKMDESAMLTFLGSPLYSAPEVLSLAKFECKCDVWSMGIVLYQMLHGKTPWRGANIEELKQNIKTIPLQFGQHVKSQEIRDLIVRMLQYDHKLRIRWEDIFEHPIIREEVQSIMPTEDMYSTAVNALLNHLRNNVVAGYLTANLRGVKQIEESRNLMMNCQAEYAEMLEKRNRVLAVSVLLMHQRNVAFFFIYTVGLMYRYPQHKVLKKVSKTGELEYVLVKHAKNLLQKLQSEYFGAEVSEKISLEDWNLFTKSQECVYICNLLRDDMKILVELLEQVEIKVKELYIKKGSGEKIAKNYKKMDGDLWKTVKNQVVKEAATMIESLPMDSLSKMLLQFLKYSLKADEIFSQLTFDFHRFYEKREIEAGLA